MLSKSDKYYTTQESWGFLYFLAVSIYDFLQYANLPRFSILAQRLKLYNYRQLAYCLRIDMANWLSARHLCLKLIKFGHHL